MLLTISNLEAGYDKLKILNKISLGIETGEIVALIGPNGAGKTTILKALFNLCTVMGGTITFQGKSIQNRPTHCLIAMGISYVPQGRLVFSNLSVRENLRVGGYLIKNKVHRENRVSKLFHEFPVLFEKENEKAGNLSGGQQQLVAIARALMLSPKILLLDEPSLGLSPKAQQDIFSSLQHINRQGTALLIVEQNVRLVLSFATRGYLLVNGSVIEAGNAQMLNNPKIMHKAYLGAV
jgi:branched-chain amino acid transport system ATP-binding protein